MVRAPLYRGGLAYGAPQGGAEQASPPPRGRDFDGRTALQGRGAPYEPGAPRPQAHLNGAEYLFTSSSDQRERSRAVAIALKWGAGWGKAGPLGGGALCLHMLLFQMGRGVKNHDRTTRKNLPLDIAGNPAHQAEMSESDTGKLHLLVRIS